MSNKQSLNSLVSSYKNALASGELQFTYQSLVAIVQGLRVAFSKSYKDEYKAANVLHGYIDFTYFYLQSEYLRKHKLKFAIVLNHKHANFELWLLGQTKEVQAAYWKKLRDSKPESLSEIDMAAMPEYSILEAPLLETPNFDQSVDELSESIQTNFDVLSTKVLNAVQAL